MARKFTIDSLPADVRAELFEQYHKYPAWTITDHAEWLKGKGYAVSRSAVYRYLSIKTEESATSASQLHAELLRLRCLEVAASIYKGGDSAELKALAESLIAWVKSPE